MIRVEDALDWIYRRRSNSKPSPAEQGSLRDNPVIGPGRELLTVRRLS